MGLSASQTRFLTLTARKSNVEYQGQQINQARTALANQSSDLFTQMMTLKAPTAPSVYDYVINPASQPEINWQVANAYPLSKAATKNFDAYYSSNAPKFSDFNIPQLRKTVNGDVTTWALKEADENGNIVYNDKYQSETKDGKTSWYMLVEDSTDRVTLGGCPFSVYCVEETGKYANGNSAPYLAVCVAASENYAYNVEKDFFYAKEDGAVLPQWIQAYNRASTQYRTFSSPVSTKIYGSDVTVTETTNAIAYERTPSVSAEDAQYNQAMEQYKKDLADYERALEIINNKCDEIHEADKKLELQLKQLDTEQEAIQTEYDSVKKVIEKNIENTFKTFA